MKDYKTKFVKDSDLNEVKFYKTKKGYKCVIKCILTGIDPFDEDIDLLSKFKGLELGAEGITFDVSAFSKCHPDDKFSETKGKRLAESRCKAKIFSKSKRILQCLAKPKLQRYKRFENAINIYDQVLDRENKHIDKIKG
jgi:hypothetical protein